MTGYFIYGDVDTRNYEGIVVSEDEVDSAPERAYEEITIAGRNGTLLLDGNRYENVIHSYDITVYDDYVDNLIKLRNDILSKAGYQVLRDSFNPDEKYLARVYTQVTPNQKIQRNAGNMHIEFSRKPQRFLVDGDREILPTEWTDLHTVTGDMVTVESDGSDSAKSLAVSLEPIQDLNGYSHPWVGGAGKNKLPPYATTQTKNGITFTVNSDGTIKANGTATATTVLYLSTYEDLWSSGSYILNGCPSGGGNNKYCLRMYATGGTTLVSDFGSGVTFTGQSQLECAIVIWKGQTVSDLVFEPMIRLASETDATYEPYENICPISGRTEVVTHRSGKNLLDTSGMSTAGQSGVTFSRASDGVITVGGKANTTVYRAIGSIKTVSGVQYVMTGCPSGGANAKWRMTLSGYGYDYGSGYTFVGDGQEHTLSCDVYAAAGAVNLTFKPMIRLASETDATYEPYQGTTYTTALGRTVYGGTLDVVSGVLTVDKAMLTLNTASMNNAEAYPGWKNSGIRALVGAGINKTVTNATMNIGTIYAINTNGSNDILFLSTGQYGKTQSEWKALAIDVQAIIELATPQTYQLTPQQIDLLLGTNHLWSDGEITLTYGVHPYHNPTPFDAKPLIKVTGRGTLGIGEYILTITGTASQTLYIDCETMEIYTIEGTVPTGASSLVSINRNDFPVLEPGTNYISVGSGITAVTIKPRWWRI